MRYPILGFICAFLASSLVARAGVGAPLVSGGPSGGGAGETATYTGNKTILGNLVVDGGLTVNQTSTFVGTVSSGVGATVESYRSNLDQQVSFHDHSGAGYWALSTKTATGEGGNLDDFTWTRGSGANAYLTLQLADGNLVSRFGMAVGTPSDHLKVPVVHGTATNPKAIETGASTFSTGSKAITFTTAFSAAPVCTCNDASGSALACSHGTTTTSGVTFLGTVSNAFDYICIGDR